MKSILKKPAVNAACLSLFTGFYALIFIATSGHIKFASQLYYNQASGTYPFWTGWSNFLASGYHTYIAYTLIAVTISFIVIHWTSVVLADLVFVFICRWR